MATYKISHIHLKVKDAKKSVAFYQDLLNYKITENIRDQYIFMSGGDSHHELALQQIDSKTSLAEPHLTALYHVAFEVENKEDLARAIRFVEDRKMQYSLVDHHGVSHALYFDDPDGNGVEIFLDTRNSKDALYNGQNFHLDKSEYI